MKSICKKTLEKLKNDSTNNPDELTQNASDNIKKELEDFSMLKTKGAILRAKSKRSEEGEKNTKYFLSLEKKNAENKCLLYLKDKNDSFITKKRQNFR